MYLKYALFLQYVAVSCSHCDPALPVWRVLQENSDYVGERLILWNESKSALFSYVPFSISYSSVSPLIHLRAISIEEGSKEGILVWCAETELSRKICKEVRETDKAGAEVKQRCGFSWKLASESDPAGSSKAQIALLSTESHLETISHISQSSAVSRPWREDVNSLPVWGQAAPVSLLRTMLEGISPHKSVSRSLNRLYPQ